MQKENLQSLRNFGIFEVFLSSSNLTIFQQVERFMSEPLLSLASLGICVEESPEITDGEPSDSLKLFVSLRVFLIPVT